ncbi:MAG: hypothetical protein ABJ275_11395 [Maricaulaceae bacterium]
MDDKIVFWGLPLKSEFTGGDFHSVSTKIKVIETLKGELPKEITVNHNMSSGSCAVFFTLGDVELVVLPDYGGKHYSTDSSIKDKVSESLIYAYFYKQMNLDVSEYRGFGFSNDSLDCEKGDEDATVEDDMSDACKHRLSEDLNRAYWYKSRELSQEHRPKKKRWRFPWTKD